MDVSVLERDDVHLETATAHGYFESGAWRRIRLEQYLWDAARRSPTATALVAHDLGSGTRTEWDYATYATNVAGVAAGLRELGVEAGDRVAVMLPNITEFPVSIFAILSSGATYSGIPTSVGPRDLGFMLRRLRARLLITAGSYGGRDLVGLVREVAPECPDLQSVIVVGRPPVTDDKTLAWHGFDMLQRTEAIPERDPVPTSLDLAHVGFTSGTTGEPKGVMNTHETLDAVLSGWLDHLGPAGPDATAVNLVASPIGHHTGFLWGILLCARLGATAALVDRWDPALVSRTIGEERVTMMLGAPTFLQDLLEHRARSDERLMSLRLVSIPGAPIPRGLVVRGADELDAFICPAWGMTEYGIGLSARPGQDAQRIAATDGTPVGGCEVRVVSPDGRPVDSGAEGDLQIRGPGLFLGYLDRPDATKESFTEGWFSTGDRAIKDDDDFVTLVGRAKDIIIRGGLNIPVAQLESLLLEHPGVLDVAVVAVPDQRLGERACACVVIRPGCDTPH